MEQRTIGSSGLRVSVASLGSNNFGWLVEPEPSRKIVHKALDLGITLFDTSPGYGDGASEEILGSTLGSRRDDVTIITKFGILPPGRRDSSRISIMRELEGSLRRLGTDHVDIYMMHFPDEATPLQETLRALDDIVSSGKGRYIACSNTPAWQIVKSKWISKVDRLHGFIAAQDEYSLVMRGADTDLLPALEKYGMGFLPYMALGNGLLTGKFRQGAEPDPASRLGKNMWGLGDRYLTIENFGLVAELDAFARERGHTIVELALAWLLSNPLVSSVLAGATRVEQLEANVAASTGWRLDWQELAEVDQICAKAKILSQQE